MSECQSCDAVKYWDTDKVNELMRVENYEVRTTIMRKKGRGARRVVSVWMIKEEKLCLQRKQ